jgi:hypothetical protein
MLARRAVFLGNALLASDNAALSQKAETTSSSSGATVATRSLQYDMAAALVPACFSFINSDDVDLRENTIRLITTVARAGTAYGITTDEECRKLLTNEVNAHTLEQRIRELMELLNTASATGEGDEEREHEREQAEHEKQLVAELRVSLTLPLADKSSRHSSRSAPAAAEASSTPTATAPEPEPESLPTAEQQPVLLLQPPSLTAASPAP